VLGLVAFLIGHVFYIIGLHPSFLPPSLTLLLPITAVSALVYHRIYRSLHSSGQQKLVVPTALYCLVLASMLYSSWSTVYRSEVEGEPRELVCCRRE
jgi:uncharacterized membrane protein YhhN